MSLKKYSFLSIFCYGLIFISPLILASIGLVKSTSELITATAVMYILGAVVLAIFYFKQREPLAIESAVKKSFCSKDCYLWIGWNLCRIDSAKHRCHVRICIVWQSNPFREYTKYHPDDHGSTRFYFGDNCCWTHHGRVRIPPQYTGDHQSIFKFLGRSSDQLFAVCVCS